MIHLGLIRSAISVIYLLLVIVLSGTAASAQSYIPIGPTNPAPESNTKAFSLANLKTKLLNNADLMVATDLSGVESKASVLATCAVPPTVAQVTGTLRYNQVSMSSAMAMKLNLPVGFGGNASANKTVLVRDWVRSAECTAADGSLLLYGQTIRVVITTNSIDGKADLTLPFIAANASLNNKSNEIRIVVEGFANPQIDAVVAAISARELNVENYGEFLKLEKDLIDQVNKPETVKSVVRIGAVSQPVAGNFTENVIIAFSLQQISDGKSCDEAKSRFRSPQDPGALALDETYKRITTVCNATQPTAVHRAQAAELLLNLKVKY